MQIEIVTPDLTTIPNQSNLQRFWKMQLNKEMAMAGKSKTEDRKSETCQRGNEQAMRNK